MGKQIIAWFAAVLTVALVVAGCGGSDSSAASITKAAFIKKADAACKKAERTIEADFTLYLKNHADLKNPTEDDYAELVDAVLVDTAEKEVEEIRALGIPSGDEDEVEALLDAREESIETAQDEPQTVIHNDKKVFGNANELATEYGLKACDNR